MNYDLYKQRASEIFGVPYDQVTDAQRKYAKAVCYVKAYSTDMSVSILVLDQLRQMKNDALRP